MLRAKSFLSSGQRAFRTRRLATLNPRRSALDSPIRKDELKQFKKYEQKLSSVGIKDPQHLKQVVKENLSGKPIFEREDEGVSLASSRFRGGKENASLPSYVKSLPEIMNLKKVTKLTRAQLCETWIAFHTDKAMLSAAIDEEAYISLLRDGRRFPLFVLPLARDEGIEFYVLAFSGHQIYLTSLLSYQLHVENAPPELILTHYVDLLPSHQTVLLRGEITDAGAGKLSLKDAQHLVYLIQEFYGKSSTPAKRQLVEIFHKSPGDFSYEKLISLVSNLE